MAMRGLLSVAATCLIAAPMMTACESNSTSVADAQNVGFWVEASDDEIVTGELVTFTAHSRNTIGRDAEVRWTSTAGEIETQDNGRIARVTFDRPGAYTVTGELLLNGQVVHQDSINVQVDRIS